MLLSLLSPYPFALQATTFSETEVPLLLTKSSSYSKDSSHIIIDQPEIERIEESRSVSFNHQLLTSILPPSRGQSGMLLTKDDIGDNLPKITPFNSTDRDPFHLQHSLKQGGFEMTFDLHNFDLHSEEEPVSTIWQESNKLTKQMPSPINTEIQQDNIVLALTEVWEIASTHPLESKQKLHPLIAKVGKMVEVYKESVTTNEVLQQEIETLKQSFYREKIEGSNKNPSNLPLSSTNSSTSSSSNLSSGITHL